MTRRRQRGAPPLAILTVCTGNICRSPLAEQMLRLRLQGDPRFEFGSAGLHAVVGAPMDRDAAAQLIAHGGDPLPPRGEQLSDAHAAAADLILTMTRSQRDEVLRRHPSATQRTFTLAEFALLLEKQGANTEDPRNKVSQAAARRSAVRLSDENDVPDPIDASEKVHTDVANQIVTLVDVIAQRIR